LEFTFAGRKTELEAICSGILYQHLWTPVFLSWLIMKAAGNVCLFFLSSCLTVQVLLLCL